MDVVVSVLIITYNQSLFVEQAIRSVLAQKTDFTFEILIGDDGSTDGTRAILEKFKDIPNVRLFLRESNIGASRNLQALRRAASGRYFAYLEGDDYWLDEDKLQKQVDFLNAHSEYVACTSRALFVDKDGCKMPRQRLTWIVNKKVFTLKDFKGVYLPGQIGTLVHRNLSAEGMEEVECIHPMIADRSVFFFLLSKGNIYQMSERFCAYRVMKSQSITAMLYWNNPNRVLDDYRLTKKLEKYAVSHGLRCSFAAHKRHLFVSAFWAYLRKRSASNREVMVAISHDGCPLLYWLYLPFGILRKIYYKLVA